MSDYVSLIFSLFGVVAVLALTYYGSKWVAKRYSAPLGRSKQMRIIDRTVLAKDKSIVLADICGEKYIIGVGTQQVTLLKDLGVVEEEPVVQPPQQEFSAVFCDMMKKQFVKSKKVFTRRQI